MPINWTNLVLSCELSYTKGALSVKNWLNSSESWGLELQIAANRVTSLLLWLLIVSHHKQISLVSPELVESSGIH